MAMAMDRFARGARIAALALLGLAAVIATVRLDREAGHPIAPEAASASGNGRTAELRRCNQVMPTSPRDKACERAWAENRSRFLGALLPASATPSPASTTRSMR